MNHATIPAGEALPEGFRTAGRRTKDGCVVALAGNPNVGKSTVFNALTGMKQHTGNWPGKTVASAQGRYSHGEIDYILVDLPGTYSLMAHSAEEEIARDFLVYGGADATVVVCDATCLERNMNLVLQTLEITPRVVVLVNLMDEAKKKGIQVDLKLLGQELGVPVIGATARSGKGLATLRETIRQVIAAPPPAPRVPRYITPVEEAVAYLVPAIDAAEVSISARWLALRLLSGDAALIEGIKIHLGIDIMANAEIVSALEKAQLLLVGSGLDTAEIEDKIVACLVLCTEEV